MSKSVDQLTAITSSATADLYHVVRSGVDKKITHANLFANINAPIFQWTSDNGVFGESSISGDVLSVKLSSGGGTLGISISGGWPLAWTDFISIESTLIRITSSASVLIDSPNINMANIPTSSAGLSAGDIWCDTGASNVLKRV